VPAASGGSPIQSYKIYVNGTYDGSTSSTVFNYEASASLLTGEHYEFTVSAENSIGEGSESAGVRIIAARIPD